MVSSKSVLEDLHPKFKSKLNHGFLYCAILKALYGFKEKRVEMFKTRFLRFLKCLELI